ncbi:MAG: hypothetical protein AAFX81_17455 [Pseudomonadota bacterium]
MPARRPTTKEVAIRERNRVSARASTGPRTALGKATAARNALTHGLRAESPRDEADIADRQARAALLMQTFEPADDFELALLHRMAAAFHRLEKADHLESQTFDAGTAIDGQTSGRILTVQSKVQASFGAINRYRATAQHDLFNAYRMLVVHRQQRGDDIPELPNEP